MFAAIQRCPELRTALSLSALLAALFVLLSSGTTGSGDANARYRVARNLVRAHHAALPDGDRAGYAGRNGRTFALYGIGQSLLFAGPEAAVVAVCTVARQDCDRPVWKDLSVLLSSTLLLPAISGIGLGFLFLLFGELGFDRRVAAATTLMVGVGSLLLPWAKFHQEENQIAAVAFAAMYFAQRFARLGRSRDGVLAAALCFVPLWFRVPSIALTGPIACVIAWFAWRAEAKQARRATLAACIVAGAVTLAWLLFYNWYRFGGVAATGYVEAWQTSGHVRSGTELVTTVLAGLFGPFVHPSKSLFLYSPLIVLALYGVTVAWKDSAVRPWVLVALSALAISVVIPSPLIHWGGDNSWGPRYQVAAHAPLLMFVASFWRALPTFARRTRVAACVLVALAILVQAGAAVYSLNLEYHRGLRMTSEKDARYFEIPYSQLGLRADSLVRFSDRWLSPPPAHPSSGLDEYRIPAFLPWKLGQRFGERAWRVSLGAWLLAWAAWIFWCYRVVRRTRSEFSEEPLSASWRAERRYAD